MDQRVSLITLGVEDVGRAQRFYEALGWKLDGGVDDETDHVAFFQTPAMIVALWDRGKLAADSCVEDDGAGVESRSPTTWARRRRSTRCSRRRRGPVLGSGAAERPRPGAAIRGSSSIPMAIPGRSPTTRAGRSTRTAARRSTSALRLDLLGLRDVGRGTHVLGPQRRLRAGARSS